MSWGGGVVLQQIFVLAKYRVKLLLFIYLGVSEMVNSKKKLRLEEIQVESFVTSKEIKSIGGDFISWNFACDHKSEADCGGATFPDCSDGTNCQDPSSQHYACTTYTTTDHSVVYHNCSGNCTPWQGTMRCSPFFGQQKSELSV
jgi:hypothetical protein